MARIYTRTGDDGTTGLFAGGRVRKDHPRVAAYGEVDELNAHLGLVLAAMNRDASGLDELRARITTIQSELFTLGAELATPDTADASARQRVPRLDAGHVSRLEAWIDEAVAATPPLTTFVLPAGTETACRLHVSRTICRRAERAVVALAASEKISEHVIIYLNRLSDLLFAWARRVNQLAGVVDAPWVNPAAR